MSGLQIKTEAPNQTPLEASQSKIVNRKSKLTLPLLLEVGCEEIPARFLRDAEKGLGERVEAALREARLLPEASNNAAGKPLVATFSTPRRLTVYAAKVLAQQPDKVEEILGPPVKVAVDAEGKYTRAAESFAQKNSARLEDMARTTTPKGEYLALCKTTPGRAAAEVLSAILPGAILGLSFPKSMYWTSNPIRDSFGPSAGSWRCWEKGSTPPRWISTSWGCRPPTSPSAIAPADARRSWFQD